MLIFGYLALFLIPVLAAAFVYRSGASAWAVSLAVLGSWLSMPLHSIKIEGVPEFDKASVLAGCVFVAVLLSRRRGEPSRFGWWDLPMMAWCCIPLASSISNDLGLYDGLSAVVRQSLVWGVPYLVGRLTLVDAGSMAAFGRAFVVCAAAYSPLCLIESRLAPQLHEWVYGMQGRSNWEYVSFYGPLGWKASVFLASPLELTPLMGGGLLFGWWLRRNRTLGLERDRQGMVVTLALVATLMGKSLGGVSLTVAGACALYCGSRLRTRWCIIALVAIAPFYAITRTTGVWSGRDVVDFVGGYSASRAQSFEFRIDNEDILIEKALRRPLLGWAGWGRNRVQNEQGEDLTVTDGLWIIALGANGFCGLVAWLMSLSLPSLLMLRRLSLTRDWLSPTNAALLVAGTLLPLHAIDCIANAMPSPIYPMIAGGLTSACTSRGSRRRADESSDAAVEHKLHAAAPVGSSRLRPRRAAPLPGSDDR